MWNLLTKENLRNSLIQHKYLVSDCILNWIITEEKSYQNDSSHWKALVSSYPVIGIMFGWKAGNGEDVRVGVDAIMGCGNQVRLYLELINYNDGKNIRVLKYCSYLARADIWSQAWKTPHELGLEGGW